jgi:hypothetical protein
MSLLAFIIRQGELEAASEVACGLNKKNRNMKKEKNLITNKT